MGLVEPPLHVAALAEIAIRPDLSASTVVEVLTRSAARRGLFIRFRSRPLARARHAGATTFTSARRA